MLSCYCCAVTVMIMMIIIIIIIPLAPVVIINALKVLLSNLIVIYGPCRTPFIIIIISIITGVVGWCDGTG